MIYIITALYSEALPIIKRLKLKRNIDFKKFQLFYNDKIKLTVTGSGIFNSAIGTTYILSKNDIKSDDILINIGICASTNTNINKGTVFMCNKILDNATKYCYYPDILFRHNFIEKSIETFPYPVIDKSLSKCDLIDMEAYSVCKAGNVFLGTHQMYFIKILSDYAENEKIDSEYIYNLIDKKIENIIDWIITIYNELKQIKIDFTEEEKNKINQLKQKLKLTQAMSIKFDQFIWYKKLNNENISKIIDDFQENIIISNKREGKLYFEKFISENL